MKNKFLLLGATALLSTGALLVKAGEFGTTIHTYAYFASSGNIEEVEPLAFGHIMNPQFGQTLTINNDGTVTGTATSYSEIHTDYYGNPDFSEDLNIDSYGSVHRGVLKVSGGPLVEDDGYGQSHLVANDIVISTSTGFRCGIVSINTGKLEVTKVDNTGVYYSYGGKLTIGKESDDPMDLTEWNSNLEDYNIGAGTYCSGQGTVTFVFGSTHG